MRNKKTTRFEHIKTENETIKVLVTALGSWGKPSAIPHGPNLSLL
jgi:hypothetical protein